MVGRSQKGAQKLFGGILGTKKVLGTRSNGLKVGGAIATVNI